MSTRDNNQASHDWTPPTEYTPPLDPLDVTDAQRYTLAPDTGAVNYLTFKPPGPANIIMGQGDNQVRIEPDGVLFRGEKVQDTGQLYKAMLGALSGTGIEVTKQQLLRACGHAGVAHTVALRILAYLPPLQADDTPASCDSEIHQHGAVVAVLDSGKLAMEGLVQEANRTTPGMDWHYVGGRAVVKTLQDPKAARLALKRAMPRFIDGGV